MLLAPFVFCAAAIETSETNAAILKAASKVEVYYFHYTRRCTTCVAVENQSLKILNELYPSEMKAGKVKFSSVNLDEKSSETITKRCKAEGQALLLISGKKLIDLTEEGFMYAVSTLEKLKQAIRNAMNTL